MYWSPFSAAVGAFQMPLLLADERPQFVQLQTANPQADHHAVMQLGTAAPDASAKAHDRVAVDASQPLDSPDAHSFGQATDDLNLLVPRKEAHNAYLPYMGVSYRI